MLWLSPFPWARWTAAILISVGALYVEFRPDRLVDAPFAAAEIQPGDTVNESNTTTRRVPAGLVASADMGSVAIAQLAPGDPVLASAVQTTQSLAPPGWWVVSVPVPVGSLPGDQVRLVLLETGREVAGVIAQTGSEDPFGATDGGVAVHPDHSAEVAIAAANGRLALLVSSG